MEETNLKDENNKILLTQMHIIANDLIYCSKLLHNKSCSENFKKELEKSKQSFCEFKVECETLAKTIGVSLQEVNWFKKIRKNAMLNLNIFFEDNTENLAKTLITNFNNNIIELITVLDNCPNAIEEVKHLAITQRKKLEKSLESYKKYLVKNPLNFDKNDTTKKPENKNRNKTTKNNTKVKKEKENKKA